MDEELQWIKEHFGEDAVVAGYCTCGRVMAEDEYYYFGGTYGYYACEDCGREWEVDLNGAMWPDMNGVLAEHEISN